VSEDGLEGLILNGEPVRAAWRMTRSSERDLAQSFIRIADGSDDLLFKVSHSADIVDDGEISNIVKRPLIVMSRRKASSAGVQSFLSDDLTFFCLNSSNSDRLRNVDTSMIFPL